MKYPTTLKGYLSLLKAVADIPVMDLKGYDQLHHVDQLLVGSISADIHNTLSELES